MDRPGRAHAAAFLHQRQRRRRGYDRLDRRFLTAIIEQYRGGPVGLSTLAAAVGEETDTIEDVYEPYLLQRGYLKRTPRGRMATPAAFAHLGVAVEAGAAELF